MILNEDMSTTDFAPRADTYPQQSAFCQNPSRDSVIKEVKLLVNLWDAKQWDPGYGEGGIKKTGLCGESHKDYTLSHFSSKQNKKLEKMDGSLARGENRGFEATHHSSWGAFQKMQKEKEKEKVCKMNLSLSVLSHLRIP